MRTCVEWTVALFVLVISNPAHALDAKQVEQGKYLVTISACNDCHTPLKMGKHGPEPDMTRMLSGHPASMPLEMPKLAPEPWGFMGTSSLTAFAGPWGLSFAANLTPDTETGLGVWTEDLFVKAMRSGKQRGGGRPILPPMPWNWYGQMTDADLKAVFAYLQSIPAIVNDVPEAILAPMPEK